MLFVGSFLRLSSEIFGRRRIDFIGVIFCYFTNYFAINIGKFKSSTLRRIRGSRVNFVVPFGNAELFTPGRL